MGLIIIKRNLVNSRMINATVKPRGVEPKVKGKARLLNDINMVAQTTFLRNAELPNTWLNCTKYP
jgi:hypothetical protein